MKTIASRRQTPLCRPVQVRNLVFVDIELLGELFEGVSSLHPVRHVLVTLGLVGGNHMAMTR